MFYAKKSPRRQRRQGVKIKYSILYKRSCILCKRTVGHIYAFKNRTDFRRITKLRHGYISALSHNTVLRLVQMSNKQRNIRTDACFFNITVDSVHKVMHITVKRCSELSLPLIIYICPVIHRPRKLCFVRQRTCSVTGYI